MHNMQSADHKLDNPVWYALDEVHKNHSIAYDGIKFYQPEYCPFGAFTNIDGAAKGIEEYSKSVENFYIVGEKPLFGNTVTLNKGLVCNQMWLKKAIDTGISEQIIPLISKEQKTQLFDLVNLVQPGYFKHKTADLGRYFGIYKNEKLIAAAGERMQMNEFTEISAVVTHPEHTRKGYAKQLTNHTTKLILKENKTPYLHVLESNIGAIKLYEKLGFRTRRKMVFWSFQRKSEPISG